MNAMTKITQHQLNATDELTQLINELFALPVQDAVHISIDGDFLKVAIDGYGSTYVSLTCSSAAEIIKKSIKDLTDFWLVSGNTFPSLTRVDLEDLDCDTATFFMSDPEVEHVWLAATVKCKEIQDYCVFCSTSDGDPQNEYDVPFDSLKVTEESRPIVTEFDGICSMEGLRIQLTDDQIYKLNKELGEFFSDKFIKEFQNQEADY